MDFYDHIATGYDELHSEEQLKKIHLLKQHLEVRPTDLLLDVGCGTGISTECWDCRKIGIDPSLGLLKQKKAKEGFYLQARAENIPFKDNTFDVVVSVTAIQNFDDFRKGLDEIKREFAERNLSIVETFSDVAGASFDPHSAEFAVVAKKRGT